MQQVNSPHNNPDPIQRSPLTLSSTPLYPTHCTYLLSQALIFQIISSDTARESFNPEMGSEIRVSCACSAWGNDLDNHNKVSWQGTSQERSEIGTRETGIQIFRRERRPRGVSWATKPISNKFIYLSGLAIFYLGWLENVSCVHQKNVERSL